jgi:hypothetical protein
MIRIIISLLLVGLIVSCKKDQLKDEKSVFVGTWNWSYTIHRGNYCEGFSFEDTLNPITEEANYSMEFFKKGKVIFYKDLLKISEHRVVFSDSGVDPEDLTFTFYLDNNKDDPINRMTGYISPTQLIFVRGFPFEIYDEGCETYGSFFNKQ